MKVCFLLNALEGSGGVAVVVGHAQRLEAHGIDAEIVLTAGEPPVAPTDVRIRPLELARSDSWDIAIGTWWETAEQLFALDAPCRCVFLQSLEERFYSERELFERLGAASVLSLPVHFVTVAGWMSDVVAELRPDASCAVVRPGIDKAVFARPAGVRGHGGPLRVLVEGQPELWFKAVPDAIAAARAVDGPVTVTLVAPHPVEAATVGADAVMGALDAEGMAALYAEHDVLVKLSRVEGLGLAPIEAMHAGLPCVVAPYTGHEEYVRHGENGFVVGFDDRLGTTATLAALARDPALLRRLSDGARATAAQWPSAAESTAELAQAMRELAAAPVPDPAVAARLALGRQRLVIGLGRLQLERLAWLEETAGSAHAALEAELLRCGDERAELQRELSAVRRRRSYRATIAARRAFGWMRQ